MSDPTSGRVTRPPARRRLIVLGLVLVGLLVATGFVHVVHGGGVPSLTVCPKDGWALSHTFVDLDDIVGRSRFELIDKAAVVRAMESCSLIRPIGESPPKTRPGFDLDR